MGRGQFQKCTSAVKKHVPIDSEWVNISYCVFDAPKHPGAYEERMKALKEAVKEIKHVIFVGLEVRASVRVCMRTCMCVCVCIRTYRALY